MSMDWAKEERKSTDVDRTEYFLHTPADILRVPRVDMSLRVLVVKFELRDHTRSRDGVPVCWRLLSMDTAMGEQRVAQAAH
jgi:hypothetical protein